MAKTQEQIARVAALEAELATATSVRDRANEKITGILTELEPLRAEVSATLLGAAVADPGVATMADAVMAKVAKRG